MRRYELDPWAGAALGGAAAVVFSAALVPVREDLTGSPEATRSAGLFCTRRPTRSVSLDARLAAVTIADQVGALLMNDGWKRKERA